MHVPNVRTAAEQPVSQHRAPEPEENTHSHTHTWERSDYQRQTFDPNPDGSSPAAAWTPEPGRSLHSRGSCLQQRRQLFRHQDRDDEEDSSTGKLPGKSTSGPARPIQNITTSNISQPSA